MDDDLEIQPLTPEHPWVSLSRALADSSFAMLPGIDPADPWCENSLATAEALFLNLPNTQSEELATFYEAYLGEGLARLFDGRWVWVVVKNSNAREDGITFQGYGIHYPAVDQIDMVRNLLITAKKFQTGSHWRAVFSANKEFMKSQGKN